MSLIRVDVAKPTQGTTVSPQSPQINQAASPKTNFKGTALIGYGAVAAQQTYNVVVNEIKAGGNEQLATTIGNITKLATTASLAIATSGLSLIPQGISAAASEFTRTRNVQRENKNRAYELETKGSLNNYLNGGGG